MTTSNLDILPDEIVCKILSNITNADDMEDVLRTNTRLNRLGKACFTQILSSNRRFLSMNFIAELEYLNKVRVPILIDNDDDIVKLINHPDLIDMTILISVSAEDDYDNLEFLDDIMKDKANFRIDCRTRFSDNIITPNSLISSSLVSAERIFKFFKPENVTITEKIYVFLDVLRSMTFLKSLTLYGYDSDVIKYVVPAVNLPLITSIKVMVPEEVSPSIRYRNFSGIANNRDLDPRSLLLKPNLTIFDVPILLWKVKGFITIFPNVKQFTVFVQSLDYTELGTLKVNIKLILPMGVPEDEIVELSNVTYEFIE